MYTIRDLVMKGFGFIQEDDGYKLIYVPNIQQDRLQISYIFTKIGAEAFKNLENITEIVIPDTVIEVGDRAFANNQGVKKIVIQGHPKFGNNCFVGCEKLKEIEFGKGTSDIGLNPISDCENLEKITVDVSDYEAFKNNYGDQDWFSFVHTSGQQNTNDQKFDNLGKVKIENASARVQRMAHNINKAKEDRAKARDKRNEEK